jgi:hypothetical protein
MTTLAGIRRILGAILLLGMSGTLMELLLLGHDEDSTQLIPLGLLGLGVAAVAWRAVSGSDASTIAVRGVMALFLVAGLLGVYYHYQANVEFQRETDPSIAGRALLAAVLRAKVPPALAPGIMVQLGLIGLAYTYRHKEN